MESERTSAPLSLGSATIVAKYGADSTIRHAPCWLLYSTEPLTASQLFVVIAASLATVGFGVGVLRVFGLRDLPHTLLLGAGYGVGAVTVAKLLHLAAHAGVPLSTAGWLVVVVGLAASGWLVRASLLSQRIPEGAFLDTREASFPGETKVWFRDPVIVVLLLLLAAHLGMTLSNNLIRPIFPWDAFTTWMYRAKTWALQNEIAPMVSVEDWIAAGGHSSYALRAHHYPTALSIYAAFMSSLVGGWHDAAASIPWSLCLLALCLTTHGMLVLAGSSGRLAVIGAYLMGSMPLLNIHAALAGYGDIWMALYSGVGLAGLLIWRARGCLAALSIGLVLLILGTQIKAEGWLWLGLGIIFIAFEWFAARLGYVLLLASLTAVIAVVWGLGITHFSLEPFGHWGIDDTYLHAGVLGSYELRLYNPAHNYWHILFEQANFLLLGGFYLVALTIVTVRWRYGAGPFWVMGLLIALSQLVIFGISAFSLYAETGTAIARLLLHFIPVALITTTLSCLPPVRGALNKDPDISNRSSLAANTTAMTRSQIATNVGSLIAVLLAPIFLFLVQQSSPILVTASDDMIAMVGEAEKTQSGARFVGSPISVGALRAPQTSSIPPAQYLHADATISTADSTSFYWINEGETRVHSTPIAVSGRSLIDLHRFEAWRSGNKREVGMLVQSAEFDSTFIKELSLERSLTGSAIPALVNQWTSKEQLSQRAINTALGHVESPMSLTSWLYISLASAALLSIVLMRIESMPNWSAIPLQLAFSLWVIGASSSLTTASVWTCVSPHAECSSASEDDPQAEKLFRLAREIRENTSAQDAILVIDTGDTFRAEKLPFLLLPKRSAFISDLKYVPKDWSDALVLVGSEQQKLDVATARLSAKLIRTNVIKLENARLILLDAQ